MMRPMLVLLLSGVPLLAQEVDLTKPPETPPLQEFRLPPVKETALDNGLRLVMVRDSRFPLITVRLAFEAGSKFDPADRKGLAETTASLLKEGTKTRTARAIAEELSAMGASLDATARADTMMLAGNVLSDGAARYLDLLADVARNASFPEDEIKLRKQNRTQELLAERSQPDVVAEEKLHELVFGGHSYASFLPSPDSIARIERKELVAFRDRLLIPNNAVLILLGDLPAEPALLELVKAKFGGWEKKEVPKPPDGGMPEPKRAIVLVHRPGSVQADIRVGQLAVSRRNSDYMPLYVANNILGGGASSRMFQVIREEKGFAYDAHSELRPRQERGLFTAVTQVRNEVAGEALGAVIGELDGMASQPVAGRELSDVKNYLNGTFVLSLETQAGLANQLAMVKTQKLPDDYLEKFVTRVRSVEPDAIQRVSRQYIAPGDAAIVIVGDADKIAGPLGKYGEVKVER